MCEMIRLRRLITIGRDRDFRANANFRVEGKTRIARELDTRDPQPFDGNRYIMFRLNCGFEPQLSARQDGRVG